MPVISSNIMGGLGNQLFQIFTTMAFGFTNSMKVVFPYSLLLPNNTNRPTYWDSFLKPLTTFTTNFTNNKVTNEYLSKLPIYRETNFNYVQLPDFATDVCLIGYWQSYKYFDHMKFRLFQMIRLDQLKESVKTEYSRYFDYNIESISMHFRLGDYKSLPEYHPILPYEYYEKSLQYISENTGQKTRVLYFCEKEDNDIVLGHIQRLNNKMPEILFIKVDDTISDWKQMILMSCCNHNIIANSTFSWWGAYMNLFEKKIVCYPSIWFGLRITQARSHDDYMKDLYPKNWIKINV